MVKRFHFFIIVVKDPTIYSPRVSRNSPVKTESPNRNPL